MIAETDRQNNLGDRSVMVSKVYSTLVSAHCLKFSVRLYGEDKSQLTVSVRSVNGASVMARNLLELSPIQDVTLWEAEVALNDAWNSIEIPFHATNDFQVCFKDDVPIVSFSHVFFNLFVYTMKSLCIIAL